MQTREQMKNWKVVGSVATVAALGISGLAVASTGQEATTPPPIEISDQHRLDVTPVTTGPFDVVPSPSFTLDDDSLDSPLASADESVDSVTSDDSPDTAPAIVADDSADSPDVAPAPAPAPAPTDDSVDSPDDSVDSGDSGDSLDS